jgi:CBS domain-containing protein
MVVEDVVSFLRAYPPFDAIEERELAAVAAAAEIEFFPRGTVVFSQDGRPVEHLLVIRAGAVEIMLAGRVLDRLGVGEMFGHASMLSGLPPGFAARTDEDTLCYRIPESVARPLLARPESVQFVARSLLARQGGAAAALTATPAVAAPVNRPVRLLVRSEPVLCAPDVTIREAAARMTATGNNAVVVTAQPLGILTDRDLRSRVIAAGLSYDSPVGAAMSSPAYTVAPERIGGDVLLEMLERGFRHFPVVSAEGKVLGVVEAADLNAAEMLSSFNLRSGIARAGDYAELAPAAAGLRPAVLALHDAGVAASRIATMYSVLLDALTRRCIELAIEQAGRPAPEFSWLALGSQARREATLSSDLDSAIASYGPAEARSAQQAEDESARRELHEIGKAVNSRLAGWGLRMDENGASASELVFVRSVDSWRHVAKSWVEDPRQEKALILVSLMSDSRPVWGVHHGTPVADVFEAARTRPQLLRLLARLAVAHRPPTGFLRGLVLDHDGEHRGTFDVKRGGLLPVVDLARWAGMATGVTAASTSERLLAASDAGTLDASDARTLQEAHELFTELRLDHHVEQLCVGEEPDDHIHAAALSDLTRSHLKNAFRAVAAVQKRITAELDLGAR